MSELEILEGNQTDQVVNELVGFSSSINTFIEKSTKLFLSISDIFPVIEKNIENEIIEAQAVIDFFFLNAEGEDTYGIFQKIRAFQAIIHEAVLKIESITKEDKVFFERVNNAIKDVKNVMKNINDIKNVSEELKVYAINSITFANRAGEKGKGYHILAKEYIQISDQLSKKVMEISNASERVLKTFSNFDAGVNVLHDFYIDSFSNVAKTFTKSANKMEDGFKNLCVILQSLIDRIEQSKDPIKNIMIDMQRQDIIQQQLEHVDESLKETFSIISENRYLIDKHNSDKLSPQEVILLEDIYKMIHTICNLNIGQLGRIQKEINVFNTKTAETFRSMKSVLDDIEDDKAVILDFFVGDNPKGESSTINSLFGEPEKIIDDMFENQERYIIQKEGIIDIAKNLDGQTLSFNKSFDAIVNSTDLINQMQLLTQIEINRNSLDKAVSGTSNSSLTVSENFSIEVPEIVEHFNKSLNQVITYVNDFINEFDQQNPVLKEVLNKLDGAKEILGSSKVIVRDYLTSMLELTDDLTKQVNTSIGLFSDLTVLENDVFEKVDVLDSIIYQIEQDVQKLNNDVDFNNWKINDEIMKTIVEKYTVASERDTALNIFSDLSIEDSESSNITLF